MSAIYQVKNNNKGVEYYSNFSVAKCFARQYLAEKVASREPKAYSVTYNEKISYISGCTVFVLTASVQKNYGEVKRVYRQNIKCPRLNENWVCAEGTQDFYARLKMLEK